MQEIETKPKLTISGYRGIWGKDLNEQITFGFALAFAKFLKTKSAKKIIIGRDARKTSPLMLSAVISACQKEELEAIDAGIIPSPSIMLLVKKLSLDGGIIITGSHNGIEYNGLKFVNRDSLFLSQPEIEEVENIRKNLKEESFSPAPIPPSDNKSFRKIHIDEILKNINVDLIRSKKYKVALDPINSAGSIITAELLKELGCETYIINQEQTGEFTHNPEPNAENLKEIGEAVKKFGADVGFAQDPDADRLVLVNELGEILSEEYSLALAVKNSLKKNLSDVVVNMSTSNLSKDIADTYGVKLHRTKVGELNVVEKIIEAKAIGGEGNGGIIYPEINTARDSLVGIAFVLELMAREEKKVSEIVDALPRYIMKKEKINFSDDLGGLYEKLKIGFADGIVDTLDGVRFDFTDSSWIQIRPSNTEPIVRIIGEAKTPERLEELFAKARLTLGLK